MTDLAREGEVPASAKPAAEMLHAYRFVEGAVDRPLLLLHGTGGDENDLVPLAARVAPGRAILSPRGNVREGGANRFFRRFAEGVFDVEDLKSRTDDLAAFIAAAGSRHGLGKPIAVGFSNGANIAASLMMRHPGTLAGAVLLRAMTPYDEPATGLDGVPVLILSGQHDPIVPLADVGRLAEILKAAGADVDHRVLGASHGLTQDDLTLVTAFLADR